MEEGIVLGCILLIYFILGASLTYIINQKRDHQTASKSWMKYLVYFVLICFLYVILYYFSTYFKFVCLWIILVGFFEIIRLEGKSLQPRKLFIAGTLIIYSALSWLFYSFSLLERPILIITFFTVSAFDAFSQTIGQMFGKSKISPRISPDKTVAGSIGGILLAVLTAVIIGNVIAMPIETSLFGGIFISLSAFIGDLTASAIKRQYQVKDFSQLIPGHGGYLDRFDSLIFAGAMVFLLTRLI